MKSAFSSLALVVGLTASSAQAEDFGLKVSQLETKFSPKDGKVEATVAYDTDGDTYTGYRLGLKATIPTRDVDGSPQSSLGEFPNSWALGPSLVKEYSFGPFDDGLIGWLELAPQWSAKSFTYQPIGDTERKTIRHSIIGYLRTVNFWNKKALAFPMGVDVTARYAQEWSDSPKVGLVTPAQGTQPGLVEKEQVLASPTTIPALTLRLHGFAQLGHGSSIALGPTVTYMLSGKKTSDTCGVGCNFALQTEIVRTELWFYYLAPDVKPANLRLGLTPFVDFYLKGESPDKRATDVGLMLQVKASAPMFGY